MHNERPLGELSRAFLRRHQDAMHASVALQNGKLAEMSSLEKAIAVRVGTLEKHAATQQEEIEALRELVKKLTNRCAGKFTELERKLTGD